jgi:hypothetical protein
MNERLPVNPEKMKATPGGVVDSGADILSPLQETIDRVAEVVNTQASDGSSGNQAGQTKEDTPQKRIAIVDQPLPAIEQQKRLIAKEINQQTKRLEHQLKKIQKKKPFSASKMEVLVKKIREYKALLVSLYDLTKDALESLYRAFVLKK